MRTVDYSGVKSFTSLHEENDIERIFFSGFKGVGEFLIKRKDNFKTGSWFETEY